MFYFIYSVAVGDEDWSQNCDCCWSFSCKKKSFSRKCDCIGYNFEPRKGHKKYKTMFYYFFCGLLKNSLSWDKYMHLSCDIFVIQEVLKALTGDSHFPQVPLKLHLIVFFASTAEALFTDTLWQGISKPCTRFPFTTVFPLFLCRFKNLLTSTNIFKGMCPCVLSFLFMVFGCLWVNSSWWYILYKYC